MDASASNPPSPEVDARRGKPPPPPSCPDVIVELRRPHTLLLLSTVAGGEAERGVFTGAIAEVLSQTAKAEIDAYELFNGAVLITKEKCKEQTPELRSTLGKSLIIPLGH
mgnify:FL=1